MQSWEAWLADPSRTGTSPPGVVERAVRAATGAAPAAADRLLHGEVNEVYDVTTTDDQRVVVRIGRHVPSLFPGERWAIASAAAVGAAVPEVLWIGDDIDGSDAPLAVCVERHAGGRPLQQVALEAGTAEGFADAVREAGRHLALVHTVRTGGFGWPLDEHGAPPPSSWADFVASPAHEPEWFRAPDIDAGRLDAAVRVLEANADGYTGDARLIHGDFGAKHVLVDGNVVRALIDFEVCRGGDPAYDVAAWDLYFHNTLRTDWLLEGYRDVTPLDDDFAERMRVCRILLAIRLLAHAAGGYKGFVPLAIKCLDRELPYFVDGAT